MTTRLLTWLQSRNYGEVEIGRVVSGTGAAEKAEIDGEWDCHEEVERGGERYSGYRATPAVPRGAARQARYEP